MAISTVEDLARILRQLPLLEPAQLDQLSGPLKKQFNDPKLLARELAKRGWLTTFQVNQIFQGRSAELVLGSYVLLERLGEGGMGEVFKARNWKLGRVVALKLIRKERVSRPETIRRFEREIRAAAKLIHPNVVLAHDAGEVNGIHFFIMDFVEGIDLAKHVRQAGPLPIAVACEYIRQAALGLQHAHEHQMVHRDIKPHNLILSVVRGSPSVAEPGSGGQRVVKILDMGLARLHHPDDDDNSSTSLTQEGLVLGTVDYVAPEQAINAHRADIRADIYSLGCTLYFLLTGQVPFPGGTATEKLIRHQCDPCTPVETLRPDVPPGLAALLRRVMAKRPDDRPQTPAALAHLLEGILAGDDAREASTIMPTVAPALPAAGAFAAIDSPGETTATSDSAWRRSRPSPAKALWIGGAAFVAFLAIIVVIWIRSRGTRVVTPGPGKDEPATLAYRVDARQRWQDTNIDVKAGMPIAVTFKGKWQGKGTQTFTAEGNEKAPRERAVDSESPALCVLGRIGASDDVLPLGLLKELKPATAGRLFVQPNYLDLDELTGNIRLEIKGGSAGKEAAAIPGLVRTQRADSEFRALQSRMLQRKEGADSLRRDLLDFARRFSGTLQDMAAAELLMPLASPLDGLDPTRIAPAQLTAAGGGDPARAPVGLVAVFGEGKPITTVALGRDDRRLATLSSAGSARVWDILSGKTVAGPWEKAGASAIAMTNDGKRLAAVVDKHSLTEWDIDGGKLHSSKEQVAAIRSLDYSGDGELLAAGLADGSVIVWKSGAKTEVFRGKEEKTAIVRVQFRPDGRRLASAAADRSMRLWDMDGGKRDVAWKSTEAVDALAFRADGAMLATAGKALRLVSPPTGKDTFIIRFADKDNDYVAEFRRDGAALFFADGRGKLFLWDVATRKELRRWEFPERVTCMASSSDGRHVVAGNRDGSAYFLRLGPPEFLASKPTSFGPNPLDALRQEDIPESELALGTDKLKGAPPELVAVLGRGPWRHGGIVHALALSPDGKHIASAGSDTIVRIWDAATGKLVGQCNGHTAAVLSLAYSPDGVMLASAGRDYTVRIWDAATTKQREILRENLGDVVSLAIGPRGEHVACASSYGATKIWDVHLGKSRPWLIGHIGPVKKVAFDSDGTRVYSAGVDGKAFAWQLGASKAGSTKAAAELKGIANLARAGVFLPDNGGLIAVDGDGKAISIDWDAERAVLPLEGSPRVQSTLALSSDGKVLAFDAADGTIRLHDRMTGQRIRTLPNRFPVVSLAFSGSGERLLAETADGIRVWDLGSEKAAVLLTGHRGGVRDLAPAPDGKSLISAGLDGSILMWDLAKGTIRIGLQGDGTPLTNLAIAPEGGRLAASSLGGWVKTWTLPAGREILAQRLAVIPNDIAWSPDGQKLIVALDNGTLATWEAASGRETESLKIHPKGTTCIAFSADGHRLASGGKDRVVKLWQWRPMRELFPLYMAHPVESLAFSPDGDRLAIGSNGIQYKDTIRGNNAGELEGATSPIRLAYHPSKRILAAADAGGRLNIWANVINLRRWLFPMPLHSVAFSADGRYLFAGSDVGAILVFRVADLVK